ncbi:hypothetical protein ACC754_45155, partial [Rhizobium johnstonii]
FHNYDLVENVGSVGARPHEHGVHTLYKIPGFKKPDDLIDKINAYRDGVQAFRSMTAGSITFENEDAIAAETYELHE